jgi:hypothetical protein
VRRSEAVLAAKSTYVAGAQRAGRLLARLGVGGGAPPGRERRYAHWLYSLTRVHDSLELARLDVPWWTYGAIDVVEAWLASRPHPVRVFEYGSGASTIWLAQRTDEVHSVEHHRSFAEQLRPSLDVFDHVTLHIVEPRPSTHPLVPSRKEGWEGLDFSDYVAAIDRVGGTFDLVVIDGRAREACLAAAGPRLVDDGMIVFDNSMRRRYRGAIHASGLEERALRGLVPTLPYPDQTSLLTKKPTRRRSSWRPLGEPGDRP